MFSAPCIALTLNGVGATAHATDDVRDSCADVASRTTFDLLALTARAIQRAVDIAREARFDRSCNTPSQSLYVIPATRCRFQPLRAARRPKHTEEHDNSRARRTAEVRRENAGGVGRAPAQAGSETGARCFMCCFGLAGERNSNMRTSGLAVTMPIISVASRVGSERAAFAIVPAAGSHSAFDAQPSSAVVRASTPSPVQAVEFLNGPS